MIRDPIAYSILRGSLTSILVRVTGVALGYVAHVVLSRWLGLHAYGQYVIALGWALVLTLPARLGFDNSALRFSTVYLETRQFGVLRGFVRVAIAAVAVGSLIAGAAMIVAGMVVGGVDIATLMWAAALILPLALLGVFSALMRTAQRIFASQFYDQVLRPGLLIFLLLALVILGGRPTVEAALMVTAIAAVAALAALLIEFRRAFASPDGSAADYADAGKWFAIGLPLLAIIMAQELMNQLEVLLLGSLADARSAGLFSAAWRLASLLPFALQALATVGAPMIASAYHRNRPDEMHRVAKLNARLGFAFALLAGLVLVLGGRWLLAIFGPEFTAAYPALLVLLLGGLVNASTGVVAYLMTLTGRERPALAIFVAALAVSLSLNLVLIPRFGIIGAAVASTSALSFWNVAMLIYVRRTIGIDASAIGLRPRA